MLFFFIFTSNVFAKTVDTKNTITYQNYIQILAKQEKATKINWNDIKDSLLMLYLWQVETYPYNQFSQTGKQWLKLSQKAVKEKNNAIDIKFATIFSYLLINDSISASNIQIELLKEKNISRNPYYLIIDSFLNTNFPLSEEARMFFFWDKNKAELAVKYSLDKSLIYAISNYVLAEALRADNRIFEFNLSEDINLPEKSMINNSMNILENSLSTQPDNLLFILKNGHYLLLNKQQESADKIFKEIFKNYPSLDYGIYIIGNYYFKSKIYSQARTYYKQSLSSITSENLILPLYTALEDIYLYSDDYNSAIKMYEDAIKLHPDSVDLYSRLVFLYTLAKAPIEESIKILNKGVNLFPDNITLHLRLADAYQSAKNAQSAITHYKKALNLNPKLLDIYENLSSIYVEQKKYDNAINILQQGITNNPNFISGYYRLSTIYLEQENIDKSLNYAQKIIDLEPNYTSAYNLLGFLYREKKEYSKAITYLKKALDLDPQYLDALLNLGDVYYEQKNYKQALLCYKNADNIEPYNENVYFSIGNTFNESGDYKNAINSFARAIMVNPKNLEARNNLGNVYIKQNLFTPAIDEFNRILKIDSSYASAYYNLACVYSLKNENNLAFDYLTQAVILDKKLKKLAKTDTDLNNIRKDKRFKDIIK